MTEKTHHLASLSLGSSVAPLRALLLGGFALLTIGCTPVSDSYPTLVNQGTLALSTTNPYLGANLFLAGELERSRYLFNFLQNRGAPVAIEIVQPRMSPTRILMFYPREREVYAADLVATETQREWIVRGPFEIERQDYRALARMETSMAGEPVFELHGKPYRFRFNRGSEAQKVVAPVIPEVPPTPVATPKVRRVTPVIKAPSTPVATPIPPTPTLDTSKPLSSDQQALLIARGFAPRDANGDVLHRVRGTAETIEQVVRWYTGSSAALPEVQTLNNLPPAAASVPLLTGSTVRIPKALVKQEKVMP